jgi:DNA-directed RNA polymerase specialized sigma24 family protein
MSTHNPGVIRAREVVMAWSTLPLFPTDDGWPYPDRVAGPDLVDDTEPDLDALELKADRHAFDGLTTAEREAVVRRFGLDGSPPLPLKQLATKLGCTRAEARDALGRGIDKLRTRLRTC